MNRDRELLCRAAGIRLLILDVDGVMTDGRLYYDAAGHEFKSYHVRDGYGIKQLMAAGIEVAVISGRGAQKAAARMAEIGIRHVMLGREDKSAALDELLSALDIDVAAAACIGDDLPELPLMLRVGLPVAVADCHPALHAAVAWRTSLPGGAGAVREVCDLLLAARTAAGT